MEWLVIDSLGWRGRTPTTYTFLHLYCYGLASCTAATICTASYLAVSAPEGSRGCRFAHSGGAQPGVTAGF
jgi:hypothetical protein